MSKNYPLKTMSQLRPVLTGFRKARGMTQKDLSARLGISQQSYAKLEANPATASIERLFRVFNILGVEIGLSFAESGAQPGDRLTESSADYRFTHAMEAPEPAYPDSPARREEW